MDYKAIIDSVLREDASIPHVLIYKYDKTRVYRIDLPTPIVMRIAEGETASQDYRASLQAELAAEDGLTSKILYWETREINDQPYGIQIQTFITGKPIDHFPDEKESKAVVQAVYILHQRLSWAAEKIGANSAPRFHELIKQIVPMVEDCPVKGTAKKLLNNSRYLELMSQPEQTMIYGDLWYKNLLMEKNGSEDVVRFVDIDPLVLGPAIIQPGILFSSYFLFTRLSLEPKTLNSFDLGKYLSLWPEPLNEYDILLMMLVFPVGLGLRKELQLSQAEDLDSYVRRSTMSPFEQSIEFLSRYMAVRDYHI